MRLPTIIGVVLLAGLVSAGAWAGGGSEAGNGGGLAEKNVTYALLNLDRYLDLCLGTDLCRVTPAERELLSKIKKSGDRPSLIFTSTKKEGNTPDFFRIDGQIRIAKTGDSPGDPIYLNTDLLYYPVSGELRAVDIPLGVSILVHELGHHQGAKDHAALDTLGSKLQTLLLIQSQRAEFWNGQAALITFQLNAVRHDEDKKHLQAIDQVVLENDGDPNAQLVSLTEKISGAIRCPGAPAPTLGLRLYNLHEERGVKFDAKTRILTKPVRGWYILSCAPGAESDHGDVELGLAFRKTPSGTFIYLPDLFRATQVSCAKDSRACK